MCKFVPVGCVEVGTTDERGRAAYLQLSGVGERRRDDRDCGRGKESNDAKKAVVVGHDSKR